MKSMVLFCVGSFVKGLVPGLAGPWLFNTSGFPHLPLLPGSVAAPWHCYYCQSFNSPSDVFPWSKQHWSLGNGAHSWRIGDDMAAIQKVAHWVKHIRRVTVKRSTLVGRLWCQPWWDCQDALSPNSCPCWISYECSPTVILKGKAKRTLTRGYIPLAPPYYLLH